jgi:hypothetical protein
MPYLQPSLRAYEQDRVRGDFQQLLCQPLPVIAIVKIITFSDIKSLACTCLSWVYSALAALRALLLLIFTLLLLIFNGNDEK